MARFVTFPGTSGNYASTDDVNLLTADQAHIYQAQPWTARSQTDTLTHETEASASVGGKVLQFLADNPTSDCAVLPHVAPNGASIAGTTQYSGVIRARTLGGVDRTARTIAQFYQGATYKTASNGLIDTLPADGSWVNLPVTGTSHADADNMVIFLRIIDAINNEIFQVDVAGVRLGATSTFRPSRRIVQDGDFQARVALDDWTPAQETAIVSKYTVVDDHRSYMFVVRSGSTGLLRLYWSEDGVNLLTATSSVAPTVSNGDWLWARPTLDVDGGAGDVGLVTFYTGGSGTSPTWVQLGDPVEAGSAPSSIFAGLHPVEIGAYADGSAGLLQGKVDNVSIRDGIDGPVVANFDAKDVWAKFGYVGISDTDTWVDSMTGRTWTLHGADASLHSGNLSHLDVAGPGQLLRTG